MTTAEKTIGVSELRDKIKTVIDACAKNGKRYRVQRNSEELAMIVGAAEWQMLNETLEILMDQDLMKQLYNWQVSLEKQEPRPAEEVFEEIEKEFDEDES